MKVILRVFFQTTTKFYCMPNFKFMGHPFSYLPTDTPFFCQICEGNIFPSALEQLFTSQNWNYQIWIKRIEQKLGLFLFKTWKSPISMYSHIVQYGRLDTNCIWKTNMAACLYSI